LPDGSQIESLTNLVHQTRNLTIESIVVQGNGTAKVRSTLSNQGLVDGMYIREIGLFATDPQDGEILYAVANAAEKSDYLPSEGSEVIEVLLDIVTIIGSASTVMAILDDSLVFATMDALNNLSGTGRTTETVKGNSDAISLLQDEFHDHTSENTQYVDTVRFLNIRGIRYNGQNIHRSGL
jgi:phage-related tail fiber protein